VPRLLAGSPWRVYVATMAVFIRSESEGDRLAVHALNRSAFGRPHEAQLVDVLRIQVQPLVSLVAVENNAVVGHIMFTPVSLSGHADFIMGLAPVAVIPSRQRSGIGTALVRTGLERCKELGAAAVVVLGHPDFYPKFGFSPAASFGLSCEYDVPQEAFMAIELRPGALRGVSGTVKYHAAFTDA
jgi:putative acetyltransferase